MKTSLKIGLLAIMISFFAAGCSGCGDRTKPAPEETTKADHDSTKKAIDTTKAKIDTAKKDTSKK
jgi:PBP1b-binding outer membrane lipoprotein LpoB